MCLEKHSVARWDNWPPCPPYEGSKAPSGSRLLGRSDFGFICAIHEVRNGNGEIEWWIRWTFQPFQTRYFSGVSADFESAKNRINSIVDEVSNARDAKEWPAKCASETIGPYPIYFKQSAVAVRSGL